MFTEYKFSPAQISEAAAATAKALAASQPSVNPAQFAATTIAGRLRSKPASYLQYGPYWWAVKQALRALGEDFGATDDADLRGEYGGGFPVYGALVAGEQFRDYYGRTFLAGSDRFDLDTEGEQSYVLFDSDMEVRRLGGAHPLRVSADLAGIEVPAESMMDSATVGLALLDATFTPFAVPFEHEATLWTANVYAADAAGAQAKVKEWEATGRISEAIQFGMRAGAPALDSTDVVPMFVDAAARSLSEMAATGALARPE